ncbi:mucoidy inhibitor MuiA family protein [Winogradskyella sp. UBA3174]|uniref:mucoidy inhibitor MuiA family protein n=1 Tax=Winogradskyella sp. UBA3174 TaxID=1947785 RepID=UPI0025ED4A8E|nr:mucoidy inhibitor MuiA family protein [Winogradskyella sp. UBA3174]|tara:strand:+ start:18180 stop:20315 length:2136 start_codon:yes stop_codon:yes gene_type:complete
MKKLVQIMLIVLSIQYINAQQESKITDVTVYLDGAEINRTTKLSLKPGTTAHTLNGLSPYIEESSIQISGLKNTSILSINYGINYLSKQKQSDSILGLQDELKSFDNKTQYEYDLIAGYNEELSLIQNNKRLGNETEVVSLEKLKTFAAYYRTRITELKVAINKSNSEIRSHQEKQVDIKRQLAEFNVDNKVQTGEIKLKLNSDISTLLDLKITYNIKNAGWFPIYDLKADKINSPINLEYKAHVFQNSGCDWSDVNLALSTSDPNTNNEKPIINAKYLNFINAYSNYESQRATRSYNYKHNPLVKMVSGIVTTSSDGLPLPGASVIEKGTSNGAQTDFDGRYTLRTTNGNTLIYSYVGMNTEELPIHSSLMNVTLDEGAQLDEVVVFGYGTSPKQSYSGVSQSLAGEAAGITYSNSSGQPGSSSSIRIRGFGSINGNRSPLYIVDGVPLVNTSSLNNLKAGDIKNTTILKDAEATAIYGARAANGVVLITLKSGSESKKNNLGITIETGITNTRFEIDKKYSIPSDGDVTVIEIDQFSVPATYDYFAAPVLNENVFLTAKIGNWEQYNLLPAEANVYFEGSYSGKTNINPSAISDSLTISLGVDPNIIVKRTQLKDFKKTTFIGSNKIVYKGFDIEIKNNKQSDIRLTLIDRIPITQNKAIKLDDIETGTSVYDKDKGLLTWTLNLKSGESDKVKHSYSVKYPKGKRVNL